jgi:type II secretory pathway pseudopilin PulG
VRTRGFTLVEIAASLGFFVVLMGSVAGALVTDTRTASALVVQVDAELGARRALERIIADIRLASAQGEDRNGNGVLDADEDTNENGVLDADWNLADGAKDSGAISFNIRTDEWNSDGSHSASGILTSRVSYLLVKGRLVREQLPIDTSKQVRRTVILKRASGMRFSRQGSIVTVALDVPVAASASANGTRTVATSVRLLN